MSKEKKHIKKLAKRLELAQSQISELEECVGHAFLSPSFTHTGLNCAASALRCFQVEQRIDLMRQVGAEFFGLESDSDITRFNKVTEPDDEPARDGTAFHNIMEQCLTNKTSDIEVVREQAQKAIKRGELTAKSGNDDFLLDRLRMRIEDVLEMFSEAEWIGIEARGKVKGLPEHGTMDVRALLQRLLKVQDLKAGHNAVSAKGNTQLMTYAVATLDRIGWDKADNVELTILGLRWDAEPWTISVKKLAKWKREFLLPRFIDAYQINPVAKPGDWCHYCPAKIHCGEWQEKFKTNVGNVTFEPQDIVDHDSDGLVELYNLCKQAENLAKFQLSPEILTRFEGFNDIPEGITRVTGQKIVTWTVDENTVRRKLAKKVGGEDNLYKRELKTPTQVNAVLGDDKTLAKFTKKSIKRPYLKVKS